VDIIGYQWIVDYQRMLLHHATDNSGDEVLVV
jgi:hypothetical protein